MARTLEEEVRNKLTRLTIKYYLENDTSDNINVLNRVNKSYELLKSGFIIDEIAKALNSKWFIIYRDLTVRLKKIVEDKFEKAKEILKQNQINNLAKGQQK